MTEKNDGQLLLANELIMHTMRRNGIDTSAAHAWIDGLSDAEHDACQALLIDILRSETEAGRVTVADLYTPQQKKLHSIIYGGNGSSADKLVAFNFADAATESLFPVGGLLVTAVAGSFDLDSVQQVADSVGTMWKNLIVLRSPQDDDAIAAARAVGKCLISLKQAGLPPQPSTGELALASGLPLAQLGPALNRLHGLKIIAVAAWGTQADDYIDAGTRWKLRF